MWKIASQFVDGFVLAFHSIPGIQLEAAVDGLSRREIVPLSELLARNNNGLKTSGLCAITVDDGVGDNVRSLAAVFEKRQWPATFYLPTGYLDSREGMPFQLWQSILPQLPRRVLRLSSETIDLAEAGGIEKLTKRVSQLLHRSHSNVYEPLFKELAQLLVAEGHVRPETMTAPAPITWTEVSELAKSGLVSFESHGVSHTAVAALDEQELNFEMQHSRNLISDHTGRPCRHFAYPYGSPLSISASAITCARRFYDSAVTMTLGPVRNANPWYMPRIPIYPSNSVTRARLKVLLKCTAVTTV
jgi:peptidoglycan/xylan/chitin deacetylase (PgdA/CDA1 family)